MITSSLANSLRGSLKVCRTLSSFPEIKHFLRVGSNTGENGDDGTICPILANVHQGGQALLPRECHQCRAVLKANLCRPL